MLNVHFFFDLRFLAMGLLPLSSLLFVVSRFSATANQL